MRQNNCGSSGVADALKLEMSCITTSVLAAAASCVPTCFHLHVCTSASFAASLESEGTRSTGTAHTSAKARLTSVAIRIRIRIQIRDPDHHQNLISSSLAHCQPSLKISCKSVRKFLRKIANRQTDRQTNNDDDITSLAEVTIICLFAHRPLIDCM